MTDDLLRGYRGIDPGPIAPTLPKSCWKKLLPATLESVTRWVSWIGLPRSSPNVSTFDTMPLLSKLT
ncbi:MAG: hypothetical protein AAF665_05820, partial [Pseudomonadota bacterium]